MKYRAFGRELTGINALKGRRKGSSGIILCSGPTLKNLDLGKIETKRATLFAVNEAIGKAGSLADFWVCADDEIVVQYASKCPASTKILAMRQAVRYVPGHLPKKQTYTVDSMSDPKEFGNGYQFWSRGTVLIGAIEMGRFMGIDEFYIFGLDCFRTRTDYYYDGRKPQFATEHKLLDSERVRKTVTGEGLWITAKLKRMIEKLDITVKQGLWDDIDIWCVNSPDSQQNAIPKITMAEFIERQKADEGTNSEIDAVGVRESSGSRTDGVNVESRSNDMDRSRDVSDSGGDRDSQGKRESRHHDGDESTRDTIEVRDS